MRMSENNFVKMMYVGRTEVTGVIGRPPVKWIDRVVKH